MAKTIYPATLMADFYKLSHRVQYPENTEKVYSTFTPRSNKYFPQASGVVVFGIQGFVKKYLIEYFNTHFFERVKEDVISEYSRIVKYTLGNDNPETEHLEALHDLGYLPIKLKALKEGMVIPLKTPVLTLENTLPEFFWLTNYLETLMSSELWLPMTSATTAREYRKILDGFAMKTVGHTNDVDFQAHDFSFRGMSSFESAAVSGAAHLTSFKGTDTIPAILYHEEYYNANVEQELVAGSVPASEHATQTVNTSYESRDEYEFIKKMITDIYPTGIVSLVLDSYDFWDNVERVLPLLKDEIMKRDGKMVCRPDSGDPTLILTGNPDAKTKVEQKGLVEALYDIFGGHVNELGYKVLHPTIGAIYGDSMTLDRVKDICERLEKKGFASTNVVLGIGSFSYGFVSRDSLSWAVKATYAVVNGEERLLFKDPITDPGKRSQRGLVALVKIGDELHYEDGLTQKVYDANFARIDQLEVVFEDGKLLRDESLAEIRERIKSQ
jgi:nicotinamide phosphoribosyltransferase